MSPPRAAAAILVLAGATLLATPRVHAQGALPAIAVARAGVAAAEHVPDAPSDSASPDARRDPRGRVGRLVDRLPIWSAPIASLVLPGLGQARLEQGRAAAYMATEAFLLVQYARDIGEARRSEREYRAIARGIARRGFVPAPPDTAWQYYEKLDQFVESGAYTMAPVGPTLPETDTSTYNGQQWLLARRQFGVPEGPGEIGTPSYQRALSFYEARAVKQPYRWSWRNAGLERDLYRRTISRTNDAYRRSTIDLSALIANHLLSAIDAFAVVRLSQLPGGAMRVSATVPVR